MTWLFIAGFTLSPMGTMPNDRPPLTVTHAACLTEGSDSQFRELIDSLLAFSARMLAIRDGLGALIDLRGVQYSTLVAIAHRSGSDQQLTINRLADHLHLSGAFMTIETGKLQKLGLITKTPNPADKREILLSVTDVGLDLLRTLQPDQQTINDLLFQPVNRKEFETLHSIFERMVDSADRSILQVTHLVAMKKTD